MAKKKRVSPTNEDKMEGSKVEEASPEASTNPNEKQDSETPGDKPKIASKETPKKDKNPKANLDKPSENEGEEKEDKPKNEGGVKESQDDEPKSAEKPEEPPQGAAWYVVHTYSGHENKVSATLKQKVVASRLEDKIFDVMVPTQEKIEIREGKKQKLRERIFPGYILVQMKLDDQSWYAVRSTAGVTGFVGIGNKPTPLDEEEVKTIQNFSKMEAPTYKASFSVGEAIKIIDGPFTDFIGTIDQINEEKGKLRVLVSIFGRETPVELDFLQASKL